MRGSGRSIIIGSGLVILLSTTLWAQFPMSDGPTADRARTTKVEDTALELEERIASMRYIIDHAADRAGARKRDPKLALAQLQEDFTHLQVTNKELVLKATAAKEIDLGFVSKTAAEITKRAERLRLNLALPDAPQLSPVPKPDSIRDTKELKAAITKIGWLIYWFTKNPIFKEAQVIDATSAAKARSDLDSIVELSLHIRHSSEQLKLTGGRSH